MEWNANYMLLLISEQLIIQAIVKKNQFICVYFFWLEYVHI